MITRLMSDRRVIDCDSGTKTTKINPFYPFLSLYSNLPPRVLTNAFVRSAITESSANWEDKVARIVRAKMAPPVSLNKMASSAATTTTTTTGETSSASALLATPALLARTTRVSTIHARTVSVVSVVNVVVVVVIVVDVVVVIVLSADSR